MPKGRRFFIEAAVAEQAPKTFLGISGFLAEWVGEVAGRLVTSAVFAVLRGAPPSS